MSLPLSINFFSALKENNNREWFGDHKDEYQRSKEEFEVFVGDLVQVMKEHDDIDEQHTKIYRIYKDVRFAKDKTPYKTSWSCNIKRATSALRGGYYLQVGPGLSYLAGGFFGPNPQDLLHIRKHLSQESERVREALQTPLVAEYFGKLAGATVKSAPKGFSKEDPNIDLLKYKQFIMHHDFTDADVASPDFVSQVDRGFRLMRPYFDVMSEILTTDLNGRSLL